MQLPPFAPDYSGVCSVFFELGGMIIIHDAAGCTGNYTGFDEPRWYGSNSEVFCSGLRQIDAILGNDEKFIQRALDAAAVQKPNFICMTGSPAPMIIGTDFDGIAAELEARSGLPCFGFPTTGLELYDTGAASALVALMKRFTAPADKIPGTVNLLGLTPQDYNVGENIVDIRRAFEDRGWHVIAAGAMNTTLDEIARAGAAQVNVAVSQCGLAAAEYLRYAYGTPYVAGAPVGRRSTESLLEDVSAAAQDGQNRLRIGCAGDGHHVLILGERVTANALRLCLAEDLGVSNVVVGGIFTPCEALSAPGDRIVRTEEEIAALLNEDFDVIIADPIFKRLLKPGCRARFADFPSPSVSGKLCWDACVPFIGQKGESFLKAIFE